MGQDGWVNELVDGWMDGRDKMVGWVDGWMGQDIWWFLGWLEKGVGYIDVTGWMDRMLQNVWDIGRIDWQIDTRYIMIRVGRKWMNGKNDWRMDKLWNCEIVS